MNRHLPSSSLSEDLCPAATLAKVDAEDRSSSSSSSSIIMNSAKTQSSTMVSSSQTPSKSLLSSQLEQFNQVMNHKPSLTTPLKANNTPSSLMFLRKVSKLIVHEQWYELDHFLRSPREGVTAFRSGMYVAKSLPRLQDTNELSGLNDMMDSSPFDTETASGGNDLSPMEVGKKISQIDLHIIDHCLVSYATSFVFVYSALRMPFQPSENNYTTSILHVSRRRQGL